MGYLVSMRDSGVTHGQLTTAVNWLGTEHGAACAGPAAAASALAGHPEGQAVVAQHTGVAAPTLNDLSDLLGIHPFPAMIWLCVLVWSPPRETTMLLGCGNSASRGAGPEAGTVRLHRCPLPKALAFPPA